MNMLAILLLAVSAASQPAWYNDYRDGIRLIEEGSPRDAIERLERALEVRDTESLNVPVGAFQYVDYLPHLYLAIAHQMSGDIDAARRNLELAGQTGAAWESETGKPLLIAYQLLLERKSLPEHAKPTYADFEPRPVVLSDEEFEVLKRDVLEKCGIYENGDLRNAPWYAFYELGLELATKGDHPRALNLLIEAVDRKPDPERKARMYGVWFIDYFPYVQIARSHVELGNWACAKNALEVSRRLEEVQYGSRLYGDFLALEMECERQLASN